MSLPESEDRNRPMREAMLASARKAKAAVGGEMDMAQAIAFVRDFLIAAGALRPGELIASAREPDRTTAVDCALVMTGDLTEAEFHASSRALSRRHAFMALDRMVVAAVGGGL